MEKLRIRLQRPVPGLDPFAAIDAEQFAEFHVSFLPTYRYQADPVHADG